MTVRHRPVTSGSAPPRTLAAVPPAPLAARFPFVAQLGERGRRELTSLPSTRVSGRRTLLTPGAKAGGAYLVTRGALRVYYVTAGGREATLYRVEPGATCVLALATSLDDRPYPAWVESVAGGCDFTRVPSATFRRQLDDEPAFRGFVLAALSGRVFELMATLEELGSAQVEARVARYLVTHAVGGEVAITQAALAAELGTAREVVFRALRELTRQRAIATGRGRIRVLAPAILTAIAARR